MIPAPFMDRRDTVRRLEAGMVLAVVRYANDPAFRKIWEHESVENFIADMSELHRRHPDRDFDQIS